MKYYINLFVNQFDNGKFFREPMRIFYIICGCAAFVVPVVYLLWFFTTGLRKASLSSGWAKITTITGFVLIAIFLIALAIAAFIYWKRRSDDLKTEVQVGNRYVGLPVLAHYVKCAGESMGAMLFLSVVGSAIITYIMALLSGFTVMGRFEFKGFLIGFFGGLLGIILTALAQFIISYLIILISRVISERLSAKAQIANDLRDTSDILRASAIKEG